MAVKYVRTAGGAWNVDATWSTTSGGAADTTAATSADDVILDSNSGDLQITTNRACRSLDCTSGTGTYAGTITHNAVTLSIGDGTAGAGNVALKLTAGMTYTTAIGSILSYVSTSATVQTITTAGKNMPSQTWNGAGGSWQFADNNNSTPVSNGTWTLTAGTLDVNGKTCTCRRVISSNSNTRSLTLGAADITTSGSSGEGWDCTTATNLTLSAASATIRIGSGANANIFSHGATATFGTLILQNNGNQNATITGGTLTFGTLTFIGAALKTSSLALASNITITGTFTATGNSVTNRVLVQSSVIGTARTITAAAVSLTNVDFMDITGAGAAIPFTGTSLGDCGGNSNITFDAPATQTNTGATGNWSDVTKWTSRVPLPQDDVVINTGSGTITADMPRLGKDIDFTGFTGTAALSSTANTIYGSLTLVAGMTLTSNQTFNFGGRGTHTITSAGRSFGGAINIYAFGGTYSLSDAFVTTSNFTLVDGTFTTNDFAVTLSTFIVSGTATKVLNAGTSTITLTTTSSATIWSQSGTGYTMNTSNTTFVIGSASTNARTFAGANSTFGTLTYTVADSPGTLTLASGAPTFGTLNVGSGRTLALTSTQAKTITNSFNVNGVSNGYLALVGSGYASAPDSVPLSITGDIELVACISQPSWATTGAYISKYANSTNASYMLANVSGNLTLFTSASLAGTLRQVTSTVALSAQGWAANSPHWVKATRDATAGVVQFFTSNDPASTAPASVSWTQLGTNAATTAEAIYDGTQALQMGNFGGASYPLTGSIYRAIVKNGIGGTVVFDANFMTKAFGADTFAESSSNAATVTLNGLATVGDGRVSLVSSTSGSAATLSKSSGIVSCDYLTIQDSTATGGAAWYAGANSVNVSGNTGWIFTAPPNGNFFLMF